MKTRPAMYGAAAVLALALLVPPSARALIPSSLQSCRKGIGTFAAKFAGKKLKAVQHCNEANLKSSGACTPAQIAASIADLEARLRSDLARKCSAVSPAQFSGIFQYPGPCTDANPGDGFTLADVQDCVVSGHEASVDSLINVEYNTTTPLDSLTLRCQKAIGKNSGTLVRRELKALQKCRNAVDKGKLAIDGTTCRTADSDTATAIAKAESKARAGVASRCTAPEVQTIGICADPACAALCTTCDPTCVGNCIVASHGSGVDQMIGFEYPVPPPPPICGDNQRNQLDEECDGTDATNCPGQCGAPGSSFPCLCLTKPRQLVIEHADSDLDNGWTGISHDSGIVEGGAYYVDLYDCDGPGGPDTLCTVGPSCSGAPHPPCSTDAQCAALSLGTCRKERTAVGPHCNLNVQQTCNCGSGASARSRATCPDTVNCPGVGNFCIQTFHGAPLPITAGGIPVCIINVFTEDVTGTRDLATGASAFRLRQNSFVQVNGIQAQPCPVCGGFCQAPQGGNRHNCTTNTDCADVTGVCLTTNPVCSSGPNVDKACRPDPPFGGPTALFGNPSVDCPPAIAGAGIIDILFNPQTTGAVSMLPHIQCDDVGFAGKTCLGGANAGATCSVDSQCPGGTCQFQCFCPGGGAVHERPNGCDAACVGGANDAQGCVGDGDCPDGFCHAGDCRPDPTAPPGEQPNEGGCTQTILGTCSTTIYQSCVLPSDCAPPACSACQVGETCNFAPQNCFINSDITRAGTPSPTDPTYASVFCITPTHIGAVDGASGLPGPGALIQPVHVITTGF